ncbi:hypothetical protein K440DRAFT_581149 [Wilcoxina mikolae CBS 423.85]|nr:hypothetical protein K440DRAFT_581149 [Wilcoxina mikolae CBS 423.85]
MLLIRHTPRSRHSTLSITSLQKPAYTTTTASVTSPPPTKPTLTTVNAPLSSIPAPLSIPPKDADTSTIKHLFRTGKAYLSFFKSGFRAIYTNYTLTRPIQALADSHDGTLTHLVHHSLITRSQFQHLLRSRHDILRVPAFGLIFIIFGETSPFILPFIPSLIPYPCRIPAQLTRERRKAAERREKLGEPGGEVGRGVGELSSGEVEHVAKVLGVSSWFIPLEGVKRWRVNHRCEYLELDDTLMKRGGGVRALDSGEELVMAAQERGIDTYEKNESEVREALDMWVKVTEALGGVKPGVWLLRPESWGKIVEKKA